MYHCQRAVPQSQNGHVVSAVVVRSHATQPRSSCGHRRSPTAGTPQDTRADMERADTFSHRDLWTTQHWSQFVKHLPSLTEPTFREWSVEPEQPHQFEYPFEYHASVQGEGFFRQPLPSLSEFWKLLWWKHMSCALRFVPAAEIVTRNMLSLHTNISQELHSGEESTAGPRADHSYTNQFLDLHHHQPEGVLGRPWCIPMSGLT